MGVLGLTPFIQKYCPEVIKELPHRLKTLSGKTLAIDGTLITQRLHFAPIPCQNRHILGWYRLIRELKDSGVGVICVFDGAERGRAKQREGERRRKAQRIEVVRGAMEVERLRRLRRLTELLNKYQALPHDQRARSAKVLQWIIRKRVESEVAHELLPGVARELDSDFSQLTHEPAAPGSTPSTTRTEMLRYLPIQNEISTEDAPILIAPRSPSQSLINLRDSTYEPSSTPETDEHLIEDEDEPLKDFDPATEFHLDSCGLVSAVQSYAIEPPDNLWTNIAEHNTPNEFEPSDVDGYGIYGHTDGSISQPDDVVKGLLSLYHNYHQSIPVVITPRQLDPTASGVSEDADAGIEEHYAMSKSQAQLTLDEGNLWRSFADTSAVDVTDPQRKLESLSRKSETLSKSYERRNNPPTTKTYEESKLILQAMGVPCIEPDVPYEAEALAASLVHHGFADYVASEDTDVLVYEAPLLRNITNRQAPLMLLSGAEFRRALQLNRASYVDFALLLGTDFSQRIRNLGPHRAIKLIRTHGRIEHVIANEPKFIPRLPADAYLEQVETARLVFAALPPPPDPNLLQAMESDVDLVVALLEKYGVYREAVADWDFASALDGNYFNDNPSMA